MPVFEFDEGATNNVVFFPTSPGVLPYSVMDGGVNFTLSAVTSGSVGIAERSNGTDPGPGVGQIGLTNTDAGVTWTLDAQSPSGTDLFGGNFTGALALHANFNSGTWAATFHRTTGANVVHTNLTGVQTLSATAGTYTHITFTNSNTTAGMNLYSLTAAGVTCYCAGTRISTPDGTVDVENLVPGDVVVTADGGTSTVKWLGRQPVNTQFSNPAKINPIQITAGALGKGVPLRDLYVSPDHAIALDGMLINASVLVNGSSIYQVANMPQDGFTYYHVETDAHELILAEGVAAESYLDIPDRSAFVNGADRAGAPAIKEMDIPRISSRRLLPDAIKVQLRIEDVAIGSMVFGNNTVQKVA
ncbi:MAG: Hint domain-containing protein [Sulfitobacter sp.]